MVRRVEGQVQQPASKLPESIQKALKTGDVIVKVDKAKSTIYLLSTSDTKLDRRMKIVDDTAKLEYKGRVYTKADWIFRKMRIVP